VTFILKLNSLFKIFYQFNGMKSAIITFCLFLITFYTAVCQSNAKITDVDFLVEGGNIVVKYCIREYQPEEIFFIRLTFVTGDNKTIEPKTLAGDVGPGIKGGDKLIVWDIGSDRLEITGSLKAVVTIVSSSFIKTEQPADFPSKPREKQLGGPGYAFLSLILPGTGGYFVEKSKARAIIFNILGAIVLTSVITQSIEYSKNPDNDQALTNRNQAAITYMAIMVSDVIWVTYKGFKNQKARTQGYGAYNRSGFTLNYTGNSLMAGYRFNF
jgi:hypothetical protein